MSPLARITRMDRGETTLPFDGDVWMTMVQEANSIKYILQSPIPKAILDLITGKQDQISHIDFIETHQHTGNMYVDNRLMEGNFNGVLLS